MALAEAGHHEHAADFARSITDSDREADALTRVAVALAEAGDHAAGIASSIVMPKAQADALTRVTVALAEAGHHEHAADIVRSIDDPNYQANALAEVAIALAKAGETGSVLRLAAATCAAGHWTTAVRPVLLLAPSAFTTLAHTLAEQ